MLKFSRAIELCTTTAFVLLQIIVDPQASITPMTRGTLTCSNCGYVVSISTVAIDVVLIITTGKEEHATINDTDAVVFRQFLLFYIIIFI